MPPATRNRSSTQAVIEEKGSGSALAGRRMVTAALLVAMTVTAMEQLVVSPAMPTIIAQLRGFEIYPWVISAYLLAATVSTPIYGKLADLYGRKRDPPVRPGALQPGLDPLGHVAVDGAVDRDADAPGPGCRRGRADRADHARRPVHPAGAGEGPGALQRRLGPLERRRPDHRRLSDRSTFGWRWVFLVSVPFAIVAIVMLAWYVNEPQVDRKVAPIDWAGAGLL